ncbi:hypothetical protein ACJJTC_013602 [Scirpophaga incertulas]
MPDAEEHSTAIEELREGMTNLHMKFIVLDIGAPTTEEDGRTVRILRVADPSACVNLAVWDEPGELLQEGDIVRLTRGYAALWHGSLALFVSKEGDLQKVGEYCLLFNDSVNMSEPSGAPPSDERPSHAAAYFMSYSFTENDSPGQDAALLLLRDPRLQESLQEVLDDDILVLTIELLNMVPESAARSAWP